ncbi:MAG: DUF4350 domain-containing protein [Gammaproteobacteria bacterium]|nr:DUF4350 domain-containing protein [Gammaproteobacteria bacterium]
MIRHRLGRIGLILLALLSIGSGVWWWLSQNLVQRREEIYTGYAEIAQRNPLYSADRLLTRLGRTVHSVRRLDELPHLLDPADTLLIVIPSYALSEIESQQLLAWVHTGGHLLVGVQHAYEPGQGLDHLLNRLAMRSHRVGEAISDPIQVTLNETMPPLQVRFRSDLRLHDAFWQSLRWGEGRVTLLTDLSLFTNARLIEHDHADFLWALLQPDSRPGGEIWLQYRMLTPSLWQLLWRHAWMPLLGMMLTLLAALWSYSRRLGPLRVPRSGEQRRLAEHLQASSHFLWRHGAGPMLLQAARHYALHQRERRQPGLSLDIAPLANSDQPLTEHALIHTLQTLQRLSRPR